ncbi:phytanoyl-CoA dioxygenase [Vibrio parahaemolyticus]|uniref:phytanoyl-CoA dioxygenase family protein n=1 Tax=Vibrio parahaemolyticus TaxID=670 RepID=UPI00111E7626|nr:phytanoyl-CoA dioxygenase family protein [Vibrio parahaemolyticus]TNZ67676.1 phytanoyl-CoA dioxygenase [Vibrio parahaemolyticus]
MTGTPIKDKTGIDWLPSPREIDFFNKHGWLVTPKIVPDHLLDDALYGACCYYAGERDSVLPISSGYLDWKPEHGPGIRLNDYVSLQNREMQKLVHFSPISQIASILLAVDSIRLFHDQLICKPPYEDTMVGWHIDAAYWKTCTNPELMLTAWIPLTDCSTKSGTLTVIDRSHLWPQNDWMNTFNDSDLNRLEGLINSDGEEIKKVPIEIKKGQVSYHHSRTIHGGLSNETSDERIALAVHLQAESNRHQLVKSLDGRQKLHMNDLICRTDASGQPDYSDPDVCPCLWLGK